MMGFNGHFNKLNKLDAVPASERLTEQHAIKQTGSRESFPSFDIYGRTSTEFLIMAMRGFLLPPVVYIRAPNAHDQGVPP